MTELERYKKAYATLVGRIDKRIKNLREASRIMDQMQKLGLDVAADRLESMLREVEEIIVADEENTAEKSGEQ